MARQRNYALEYARRQARARSLGYGSYYERRVRAGAPPSAPKPTGEALARVRGHRGYRDLLRGLRDGDIVQVDPGSPRDDKGRWKVVRITVLDAQGNEHTYTLRNVSDEKVRALLERMENVGAISSPAFASGAVGNLLGTEAADQLDLDLDEAA